MDEYKNRLRKLSGYSAKSYRSYRRQLAWRHLFQAIGKLLAKPFVTVYVVFRDWGKSILADLLEDDDYRGR